MKNIFTQIAVSLILIFPLAAQEKNMLEEEIADLHVQLNTLVTDYIETRDGVSKDGTLKLPLDMGLRNRIEDPQPFTFKEEAILKVSGKAITGIEFYFTKTIIANLMIQTRRYVNEAPGGSTDGIKIIYESNMDEGTEIKIADLGNSLKHVSMRQYRDYLTQTVRVLQLAREYREEDQRLEVNKVIFLNE